MLKEQKSRLAALFAQAASELAARAGVEPAQVAVEVTLERPKQAAHGDLACNLAMQLAKPLKAPPRKTRRAAGRAGSASSTATARPTATRSRRRTRRPR